MQPTPANGEKPNAQTTDWPSVLAQHARWLRTVALARTGEPQAVDEVMQEVAMAVVTSAGPDDPARISPWLYRITVRQSLLYRRRMGRMRKMQDRYADRLRRGGTNGHEADPLAWLIRQEQGRLIRTALGRLPRRDAEALMLKYLEGWSYPEIAERLGISQSAIVSRVNRARSRLRAELAALDLDETTP